MNIIKKINIHHLLAIPFIIIPFLVTHRFQDPTLLIKRSGVFFFFGIISLLLIILKANRNTITNSNQKCLTLIVGFIIFLAIISSYNSINPSESYWELLYLSGWISIYAIFMFYSTKKTMKYIIVTSSVVGAVLSLLLFNDVFHVLKLDIPGSQIMRSTFGNRNLFGQYLCFIVPASIISIFLFQSKKGRFFMIINLLLIYGGLILNRNRASWIAISIIMILFIIFYRYRILKQIHYILKNTLLSIAFLLSIIIIFYFTTLSVNITHNKSTFIGTLSSFINYKNDSTWLKRIDMYQSTIKIIKDHPILGIGLGNWRLIKPKYSDNSNYIDKRFTKIIQRPHNDFLWLLSEVGIIGMIFIIGFLIYHLRLLFKVLKKYNTDYEVQYLFMFCLMSLIAIGIESMFDFPKQRAMPNLYFWSIMGFIPTSNIKKTRKDKYQNKVPKVLFFILSVVCMFAYFDMKSNIYSQDAKYYNNNNMPKELYASSAIALSFYRNLDNAGTPIYYYMGIAKHQLGDKNAAKLFFQRALQLAPFHIGALTNYMILLGELGELTSAHKIMSIIQHVYPRMAKPRLDMAKFYLREGKKEEAEKILLELKEAKLDDGQGTLEKLLLHVGNK